MNIKNISNTTQYKCMLILCKKSLEKMNIKSNKDIGPELGNIGEKNAKKITLYYTYVNKYANERVQNSKIKNILKSVEIHINI